MTKKHRAMRGMSSALALALGLPVGAWAGAVVPTAHQEVAFIEANVPDHEALVRGMAPGVAVQVLDSQGDGLAQMAEYLAQHGPVGAVHLFSHGAPGQLQLGHLVLSQDNLQANAHQLSRIGAALQAGGGWLVYGCDVGRSAEGEAFVAQLSRLSGVPVAASSDVTGNPAQGGNWELEVQHGVVRGANPLQAAARDAYTGVLLAAPTLAAAIEQLTVSGASAGATVNLHKTIGGDVVASAVAGADGTATFNSLLPVDGGYYATQVVGGVVSGGSTIVNPGLRTPTVTPGTEQIDVSNVPAGTVIELRKTEGGGLVSSSPIDQSNGTYRFSNLLPVTGGMYVVQSLGGVNSGASDIVNPGLRTPAVSPGTEQVDVSNVPAGTVIALRKANGGTLVSSSPADLGNGTYRFSNVLPEVDGLYVDQSAGGISSAGSTIFNVGLNAPVASWGVETIEVSGVRTGATVELHKVSGGTLVPLTATDEGNGVFRFNNVTPEQHGFYVVQSLAGVTSANTPFDNVILRTPVASGGIQHVDVTNVFPGATVTLYQFNGTPVSSSPTSMGGGLFRFTGVPASAVGYYVRQEINSVLSPVSGTVAVTATAPSFVGGLTTLTVNPGGTGLREQVAVSDIDVNETLTWSVGSAPSHGTLSGLPATANSSCSNGICGTVGSTVTLPGTQITYTPNAGYTGTDSFTLQVSDGGATVSRTFQVQVNAASGSTVAPANSTALAAALRDPGVGTINLVSGMTYQVFGTEINRPLTIHGNGAVVEVLGGMGEDLDHQAIFHLGMPDADGNRRYRGNLFWRVSDGGNLRIDHLTLRNAATTANAQGLTGVYAAIFLTGQAQATLDTVVFENFWFQNSQFMAQNNLATAQGLYASYADLSHGVYTDRDFVGQLSVTGSTFGSSNAFREAVHLYNSASATISGNTFNGTAHPSRLRAADGFENGIYLYGGHSTITNNTISGYLAHLNSSYYSAGIASVGFQPGSTATITGNTITNSSTGLSLVGGWQSYQSGGSLSVNGYSLITDPGLAGFTLGNSNTLGAGVHGPRIAIAKDQNDSAGAYADPLLTFSSRTDTTATLGLASATTPAINTTAFSVEQSTDGSTWSSATVEPPASLNAGTTSFTVSGLSPTSRYYFRLNDTDTSSHYYGLSNLIALPTMTLGAVTTTTAAVNFAAPGTSGFTVEQSTDSGASWSTATLQGGAISASATSAVVTGLVPGTAYQLRLKGPASNGWGTSSALSTSTLVSAACGTANQVPALVAPSGASLCAVGTPSSVADGAPWTWSCTTAGGTSIAYCSAPNAPTSTGSGSGRLALTSSSGATAWQVRSASFVSVASTGSSAPPGATFPHGLLDLRLDTGTQGTSATVTITYPAALPPGSSYWKYGKTAVNPTPHWYQYSGAQISGNTVVLTLTDGGAGDDDLTPNSLITDPGGVATFSAVAAQSIPTLSQWGQLLLWSVLGLVGAAGLRRRKA